ncbi:hypothetical protein ISF_01540 [Cordyceps fumosorosea ARSEF 2679]|uniref:Uncharacterized protein n=1 Tax=Cordyceps fumosorosea (strain ARSEF 2679) TaxID=1081104 RepID=A0A168DDA5_CORFA|nr:hypothetical protein ISF_01540 [Cordyceps fumosorosea ARSEF 2679]OAA72467.1 hypothetical protein ISF_01540 [Cordyceps fumosorosea ARSEF 2679]
MRVSHSRRAIRPSNTADARSKAHATTPNHHPPVEDQEEEDEDAAESPTPRAAELRNGLADPTLRLAPRHRHLRRPRRRVLRRTIGLSAVSLLFFNAIVLYASVRKLRKDPNWGSF